MLPKRCTISSTALLNTGDQPFASGALTDMYEGTLNGSKVRVERVRMYATEDPQLAKKVRPLSLFLEFSLLTNLAEVL